MARFRSEPVLMVPNINGSVSVLRQNRTTRTGSNHWFASVFAIPSATQYIVVAVETL